MLFGLARSTLCGSVSVLIASLAASGTVSFAQQPNQSTKGTAASETSFAGQTIRLVVGSAAGGTMDLASRLVAKYLHEELVGHPTLVVQNVPGAAGLVGTNTVLRPMPEPPLVLANVGHQLAFQQVLQNPNMAYDMSKINWIGSSSILPRLCVVRTDLKITTIEEARTREIRIAGSTAGTGQTTTPVALNRTIGTQFKVIKGYQGISQALLAVERGEADGICVGMIGSVLNWIEKGFVKPLIVMGTVPPTQTAWLEAVKGVPNVNSYLTDPAKRRLLDTLLLPSEIVYGFALNQNTHIDIVRAFRAAFERVVRRREFEKELVALGEWHAPKSADEVLEIVTRILSIGPDEIAEVKQILEF